MIIYKSAVRHRPNQINVNTTSAWNYSDDYFRECRADSHAEFNEAGCVIYGTGDSFMFTWFQRLHRPLLQLKLNLRSPPSMGLNRMIRYRWAYRGCLSGWFRIERFEIFSSGQNSSLLWSNLRTAVSLFFPFVLCILAQQVSSFVDLSLRLLVSCFRIQAVEPAAWNSSFTVPHHNRFLHSLCYYCPPPPYSE